MNCRIKFESWADIIADEGSEVSTGGAFKTLAADDNLTMFTGFASYGGIMSDLAERECVPCRGGIPPLKGDALEQLAVQLPQWQIVNEHHLQKAYEFKNFREALDFVNRIGELAEAQGHHPDICFGWGKADISIWTHKVDGLTESDFVLAAKIDRL